MNRSLITDIVQCKLKIAIMKYTEYIINSFDSIGEEHLIALLTPQSFQIPLTPRMFQVWDFVIGIFARKAVLNSGRVLSTLSC